MKEVVSTAAAAAAAAAAWSFDHFQEDLEIGSCRAHGQLIKESLRLRYFHPDKSQSLIVNCLTFAETDTITQDRVEAFSVNTLRLTEGLAAKGEAEGAQGRTRWSPAENVKAPLM